MRQEAELGSMGYSTDFVLRESSVQVVGDPGIEAFCVIEALEDAYVFHVVPAVAPTLIR